MDQLCPLLDHLIEKPDTVEAVQDWFRLHVKSGYHDGGELRQYSNVVKKARSLDADALAWLLAPLIDRVDPTATAMLLAINRHPLSVEQILAQDDDSDWRIACLIIAEATDRIDLIDAAVRAEQANGDLESLLRTMFEACPSFRIVDRILQALGQPPNVFEGMSWNGACPLDAEVLHWGAANGAVWSVDLVYLLVDRDRADLLQEMLRAGFVIPEPPSNRYRRPNHSLPEVLSLFLSDARWSAWLPWIPLRTAIELGRFDWLQVLLGSTNDPRVSMGDVLACILGNRIDMLDQLKPHASYLYAGSVEGLDEISIAQLQRLVSEPLFRQPLKGIIERDSFGRKLMGSAAKSSLLLKANCLAQTDLPWAWIGNRFDRLILCIEQYGLGLPEEWMTICLEAGKLPLLDAIFDFCDQLIAKDDRLRTLLWFADQMRQREIDIHPTAEALRSLLLAWLNDPNTYQQLIESNETASHLWFNATRHKYGLTPCLFTAEDKDFHPESERSNRPRKSRRRAARPRRVSLGN